MDESPVNNNGTTSGHSTGINSAEQAEVVESSPTSLPIQQEVERTPVLEECNGESSTTATISPEFDSSIEHPRRRATHLTTSTARSRIHHEPHVFPRSIDPSSWTKRRIRIASCGCLSSIIVCTVRLILDPGPSAYVIHSIIILFDMLLIHIFTYTPWLSIIGELTAILFALCFHFTNEKIFELLETTLIAVWVSFHMIGSRNEYWDREEVLEQSIIGLQLYIEHNEPIHNNGDIENTNNVVHVHTNENDGVRRRRSSFSKLDDGCEVDEFIENQVEGKANVHVSDVSMFHSTNHLKQKDKEYDQHWCNHFFDHFLDGSAGVMYTSLVGLIIDEIINFGIGKSKD